MTAVTVTALASTSPLTTWEIARLTAAITGTEPKKAATKLDAATRFFKVADQHKVPGVGAYLAGPFDKQLAALAKAVEELTDPDGIPPALRRTGSPDEVATATAARAKREADKPRPAPAPAKAAPKGKAARKAVKVAGGKSKKEIILDMVLAKGGATEAEICKKIGWKACLVTLRRAAEAAKVTLTHTADETTGKRRYFGKPAKAGK